MKQEYIMYAGDLNGELWDFYNHLEIVKCGGYKIIYKVKLTISDKGTFWGWYDVEEDDIMFIYYHKDLINMCFPYGVKAESNLGRGEIVQLKIEILEKIEEKEK